MFPPDRYKVVRLVVSFEAFLTLRLYNRGQRETLKSTSKILEVSKHFPLSCCTDYTSPWRSVGTTKNFDISHIIYSMTRTRSDYTLLDLQIIQYLEESFSLILYTQVGAYRGFPHTGTPYDLFLVSGTAPLHKKKVFSTSKCTKRLFRNKGTPAGPPLSLGFRFIVTPAHYHINNNLTARKVFSKELPVMRFLTFVRTKAEPFPGLTCKNSKILQGFPGT